MILLDRLAHRYGQRPSSLVGVDGACALALDALCMEAGAAASRRAIGDGMIFPVAVVAD